VRNLESKTVAITGAASGIGAALARAIGEQGASLGLMDIEAASLGQVADELRAGGATVSTHRVDVRRLDELEAARDAMLAEHGAVDVLVNNAGVTTFGAFEQLELADVRRVIDINLWGVVYGCRAFVPVLRSRPAAHIVNVASEAGLAGMPWQSVYCASKFAVRGFSDALRAELAASDIGVTCVLPGATATNILASASSTEPATSDRLSQLLQSHAMSPERLARKIVRGVRRNRAEVIAGIDGWLLHWGTRATPGLVRGLMRLVAREANRRERGARHEGRRAD
jgi:short-subunit dehydrogenase